jgi:ornithine cyclodeaminase/alanine dehydrogenase-like protein (mu-crystallin family)
MHAWIGDQRAAGVKIINASSSNADARLPRASGLTLFFDPETARVKAVMPAEEISAARTAAVSVEAVTHTRAPGSRVLGLVGCGPIGDWHVRLLASALPGLDTLVVYDRSRERADRFVGRWRGRLPDWSTKVAVEARAAVEASDLVIAATTTTEPYVVPAWLRPGATVVSVSLDDLDADVLLGCDRLFVDDWNLVIADERHLLDSSENRPPQLPEGPNAGRVPPALGDLDQVVQVTFQLANRRIVGREQSPQPPPRIDLGQGAGISLHAQWSDKGLPHTNSDWVSSLDRP